MHNFSVPMGLMDFIPVFFFGVSAVLLIRDLYNKMGKAAFTLLAAGSVNVFMAGFCKALWKTLYAANICDFVTLEEMFMPVNSIGLLMVGLSLVMMVCCKRKTVMFSAAPVAITSSLPFIAMMVLGLGGMCTALSILAARMKKGRNIIFFVLSFVCAMGMGYMSSKDSSLAWVNWAEQSINTVSQLCLMLGVISLHRANLASFDWRN